MLHFTSMMSESASCVKLLAVSRETWPSGLTRTRASDHRSALGGGSATPRTHQAPERESPGLLLAMLAVHTHLTGGASRWIRMAAGRSEEPTLAAAHLDQMETTFCSIRRDPNALCGTAPTSRRAEVSWWRGRRSFVESVSFGASERPLRPNGQPERTPGSGP